MFKYKFLENGISYSGGLLIGYGLCNGTSGEMVNHHQYVFIVILGGRQLHNQVSRYLSKSSSWYLSCVQLILVSLNLLPLTQGAAVYMGLNVFIIWGSSSIFWSGNKFSLYQNGQNGHASPGGQF